MPKAHLHTYKGKAVRFETLVKMAGVHKTTLRSRLHLGWTVEEAVEGKRKVNAKDSRP